jgi:hypothetical protein
MKGRFKMDLTLEWIPKSKLNKRQIEAYNLQKVSAVLADLGFVTIRVTSDWGYADFIAQHIDGEFIKVQLKGRLSFYKKYCDKNLFICFPEGEIWYLYPHDEMLEQNLNAGYIGREFWKVHGGYTNPKLAKGQRVLLEPYKLKPGLKLSV